MHDLTFRRRPRDAACENASYIDSTPQTNRDIINLNPMFHWLAVLFTT